MSRTGPRARAFQWPWRSRARIASDVDAELSFHLEMRVDDLVRQGMAREDAVRRARAEFGDLEFTRAYCRAVDVRADRAGRLADRLADWRQDVRFALRTLRRAPGFTAVALITLALAVGANTAIFSVARAVLLAPLPYGHPGSLAAVFDSWPGNLGAHTPLSPPDFVDYRAQQRVFTDLAAFNGGPPVIWQPAAGDPTTLTTVLVGTNLFRVLEVRPLLGRAFVPADDAASTDGVVLSYDFWQRELGGDSAVVGRRLTLNGQGQHILGVMPRGFTVWGAEDLWMPLDLSDDLAHAAVTRKQRWVHAVGRLRPGMTLDAARAGLAVIGRRLAAQYPEADSNRTPVVMTMRDVVVGDRRPPLLLLQGAALLVLLIACANLANLTLSRTIERRREMALRAALGAGRGRLVRQLLTESMVLSIAGGTIGVALAIVATRTLLALNPDALPPMFRVGVDDHVLLFSLVVSLGAGVLFGLAPALEAMRADVHDSLKEGTRGMSGSATGRRIRRALVAAQVGLAVMLLVGAGLLVRSYGALARARIGFDPEHVLTAQLRVAGPRYDSAAAVNGTFDAVLGAIARAPGVIAAGAVSTLPTEGTVGTSLRIEGEPVDEANLPDMGYVAIRGNYLTAMRIPLLGGRAYDASDLPDGPKTVLINETAARRFFPRGDAVGRRIRIGPRPDAQWMTIIGVVGDVRDEALDLPPKPELYANHRQESWERTLSIVIRTAGDPATAIPILRRAVHDADPSLALRDITPLDRVLGSSLAPRRFALGLASSFAALALLLAAVGIYGVLAYAVTTRRREFGVRLALGAPERSIIGLVLGQGLAWSAAGLVAGLAAALGGSRLLARMLYGVSPLDPATYASVVLGLVLVVTIACLVPALRATRVDPLTSMRAE